MKLQSNTEAAETARTTDSPAVDPVAICSACGQKPRRKLDYGDFTEYDVRCFIAEYCLSVTVGTTGWSVPFTVWVESRGIAKFDGRHRLIRLPNVQELA